MKKKIAVGLVVAGCGIVLVGCGVDTAAIEQQNAQIQKISEQLGDCELALAEANKMEDLYNEALDLSSDALRAMNTYDVSDLDRVNDELSEIVGPMQAARAKMETYSALCTVKGG